MGLFGIFRTKTPQETAASAVQKIENVWDLRRRSTVDANKLPMSRSRLKKLLLQEIERLRTSPNGRHQALRYVLAYLALADFNEGYDAGSERLKHVFSGQVSSADVRSALVNCQGKSVDKREDLVRDLQREGHGELVDLALSKID